MTSEATVQAINNLQVRQVLVADGSAFAKGTLMFFEASDGTVNHYANGVERLPAGFLRDQKVASDGQTAIGVQAQGTVTCSVSDATVTVGDLVVAGSLDNCVRPLGAASIEKIKNIIGRAETGGTAGTAIRVRLTLLG